MCDIVVMWWVFFVLFFTVFLSVFAAVCLFRNQRIKFDRGFYFASCACLIAFVLSAFTLPAFHRVYYDENILTSQAVNILSTGKPNIVLKGSRLHPEAFASWAMNLKLPGFACLESSVLFFTRDFNGILTMNFLLGILLVGLVYRLSWLLSHCERLAWWSACVLACLPARVTYCVTASLDVSGLFFFLLFCLFLFEYRDCRHSIIMYAAIFAGAYSVYIKPFYLILDLMVGASVLYFYRRKNIFKQDFLIKILIATACLMLPAVFAVPIFFHSNSKLDVYSINYVLENLRMSFCYLINERQNLAVATVFVLVSTVRGFNGNGDILSKAFAGWLWGGILLFSVFNSGGISFPGHAYSDRYFLILAFPFVYLAGKGIVDTLTFFRFPFSWLLILCFLLFNGYCASQSLTAYAKNNFHYQKALLLKKIFPLIDDNTYILDESAPFITTISDKKAIQMNYFLKDDHPSKVIYLMGNPLGDYAYDDPVMEVELKKVLDKEYLCKLLTGSSVRAQYISAVPYICLRLSS